MTDFKAIAASLEARGFCVIPEFLSREEIAFLVEEFDACPDYAHAPRTKHAARHLGDQPVAGQTGALRSNAMGRKETFQRSNYSAGMADVRQGGTIGLPAKTLVNASMTLPPFLRMVEM